MTTLKQQEANRMNAQKSTGPRTESGKRRSALNALRHGLTAQVSVMPEEERVAFESFTTPLIDALKPANPVETQLAVLYASCQWRLNRAAAIEESMFTLGNINDVAREFNLDNPEVHNALTNAVTFAQSAKSFEHITLYANRLLSQSEKALKRLKDLQSERKAQEISDLEEAALIQHYLDSQGLPFDPAAHGFVLPIAEIHTYVARRVLFHQARCEFHSHSFHHKAAA